MVIFQSVRRSVVALFGLITFFSTDPAIAFTNDTSFARVWKTDDGLINNNIMASVQGTDDYLWVVPSVGLMRFDGISFSRFPLEDFIGPANTHICTVFCDRKGVLWIATYGQKVIGLNPDFSATVLPARLLPAGTPLTLAEDKTGALWLGYISAICRFKEGQITRFGTKDGVPPGSFYSLTSDGAGNIWLAKGKQIAVFQNGQFQHTATVNTPLCLAATHTNAIWFVADSHLYNCNTEGTLRDCGDFPDLSTAARRGLLEDHPGSVWIGTDYNGLFHYDQSGLRKIETSSDFISSLAEDREGNIWVSENGGGLERISLNGIRCEAPEDPTLEQVQSICQDASGVLWGATQKGWLVSRIGGMWQPAFTNALFGGNVKCVVADRKSGIWLGTRDGELIYLNDTNYFTIKKHVVNNSISGLLPASSGDLWILDRETIHRLHDGQWQNIGLPRQNPHLSAIAEDSAGTIWIGGTSMLMRFDGTNFVDESSRIPILDRNICCLYPTPDGSVWFSCGGLGLLRIKNGNIGQIGLGQGLFNDYISQIVADNRGWLWFASDHGIFKIRQRELDQAMEDHTVRLRPIVYGQNEGLSSLEALFSTSFPFVLPTATCSHDGRVWLLTHTGIVVADPKVLPENYPSPPVLLTQVAMDGHTIASYGGVMSTQTVANLKTLDVPLRIPPSHHHLEFDYTAFHFAAPENIHFRYQLVGFDNDWINAKTARSASYSRLASGNYQFRVAASTGDGPWSETPEVLNFVVIPFFWQTWWFRMSVLVLFTSAVIAIVRYVSFQRLQTQMRLLEQRAALDKERTRIARDLHDDLGGSLNRVALTLDMMQRGSAAKESINEKIEGCSMMVRQVAMSVDEIVWAINPRNDTLHYMVDYISQFAVEFLHAAEIPCRISLPDNIPIQIISPEARHNLLLVVKEALNNVTRHARATEARLRITADKNQVAITIEDNGCGFEYVPDNSSCDGLRNMRQRMEEIGGQFQLVTRPGAGTCIAFLYSWAPKNGR